MSGYPPDASPDAEAALGAFRDAQARAGRQLEAMGGTPEAGTDAGERYAALEWDAHDAYVRYSDTWLATHPGVVADADSCPGRIVWHEPEPGEPAPEEPEPEAEIG